MSRSATSLRVLQLETWLQSLSVAERLLAKLQTLNDRLEATEAIIPHRVAEAEPDSLRIATRQFAAGTSDCSTRGTGAVGEAGATGSLALDQLLSPLASARQPIPPGLHQAQHCSAGAGRLHLDSKTGWSNSTALNSEVKTA